MLPLLGFAEFTDFLDGFYARKEKAVTDFGKLFDPFADVILHLTAMFCYVQSGYMPMAFLLLIFIREYSMLFIRLMAVQKGVAIGARKGGKFKTVLYVGASIYTLAIESLIRLGVSLGDALPTLKIIGLILFGLGLIASYTSFADYLINYKKIVSKK
jgi:CDP-diacylglycerol--glycerol-3-phosphate 3-phosphatidyltransferase